jgi:aspartokinase/homoserine dehydrogenase 1
MNIWRCFILGSGLESKKEGYTEPNPLLDLSGVDVMRKILILSRESGLEKEMKEIEFTPFIPEACNNAKNNDALFAQLTKDEPYFQKQYLDADINGCKLKVIATLKHGKLSVGLKQVSPDSPYLSLKRKRQYHCY